MGAGCFYNCKALTKAVIGNGVQALKSLDEYDANGCHGHAKGIFENCVSLESVKIGNGVTEIGIDAFTFTSLKELSIPDNVVTLGDGVCYNCQKLEKVTIGEGVTSVGSRAFAGCSTLKDINIGHGVVSIGDFAFLNCNELEKLVIPSNVTSLGEGICYYLPKLKKVVIGNGVTEIKTADEYDDRGYGRHSKGCFEGCSELEEIALGSGLISIGEDSFTGTALKSIVIPSKVSNLGNGAFYNSSVSSVYFTGVAPSTFGSSLFGNSNVPSMYNTGKMGYDGLDYVFKSFTPVTVKFDKNNDAIRAIMPLSQLMQPTGGYVIEPISPTANGYLFLGWFKDNTCTVKWDFINDKVTESTTLYAGWAKVTEAIPEVPKVITSEEATHNTASIKWDAVDGADSYNVYVNGVKLNNSPITECNYSIEGLEPNTSYEIAITAVNKMGESEWSLIKVVDTAAGLEIKLGDVNGDGEIDLGDTLMALKLALGIPVDDAIDEAADVDGVDGISLSDVLLILKKALGIEANF